ncbi:RNA-binding protein, partial [archaeon]
MTKLPPNNKICTVSHLPYQPFRWKAGPNGRFKETVISYVVAAERNICQCCLNDLRYGLPVGVRDAVLQKAQRQIAAPTSEFGTQVYYQQKQQQLIEQGGYMPPDEQEPMSQQIANLAPSRQLDELAHNLLTKAAQSRTAFRNLPKLCTFWLNGRCTRVGKKSCPFRPCCGSYQFPEIAGSHRDLCKQLIARLEAEGPDAVQRSLDEPTRRAFGEKMKGNHEDNIRKRVAGQDELTEKYLGKLQNMNKTIEPPSDPAIKTVWLGGLDERVDEDTLRSCLYPYGLIVSLFVSKASQCAFVEFADRATAENAVVLMHNTLVIGGKSVSVNWAKPPRAEDPSPAPAPSKYMPAPPGMEHMSVQQYALPNMPLPKVGGLKRGAEAC